tara:strand:- start:91 stop:408 length:318 start_codon:yes stop_codon:yes gene_type:complete
MDQPNGPWSLAVCRFCGTTDAFPNASEGSAWTTKGSDLKKTRYNPKSKQEFLRNVGKSGKINGVYTNEFKQKAVHETTIYGRKFVRIKYGLPETTLRGWIQRLTK